MLLLLVLDTECLQVITIHTATSTTYIYYTHMYVKWYAFFHTPLIWKEWVQTIGDKCNCKMHVTPLVEHQILYVDEAT